MKYLLFVWLVLSWGITPAFANPTFVGRTIRLPEVMVATGKTTFDLHFVLPPKHQLNHDAPLRLRWHASPLVQWITPAYSHPEKKLTLPYAIEGHFKKGLTTLIFEGDFYFCPEKSTICYIDKVQIQQPVRIHPQGKRRLTIQVPLQIS